MWFKNLIKRTDIGELLGLESVSVIIKKVKYESLDMFNVMTIPVWWNTG